MGLDHEAELGMQAGLMWQGLLQRQADFVVPVVDDLDAQFAFASEVGKYRGFGDACSLRDHGRRAALVAVAAKDGARGLQQGLRTRGAARSTHQGRAHD